MSADLLYLSVFALFTKYLSWFLFVIRCLGLFRGNILEKFSIFSDFFAKFRAILSLLSIKLSKFMFRRDNKKECSYGTSLKKGIKTWDIFMTLMGTWGF